MALAAEHGLMVVLQNSRGGLTPVEYVGQGAFERRARGSK